MSKKTAGQMSLDLQKKEPEQTDAIEMERIIHHDYDDHVKQCIEDGKKVYAKDFYIVVITKAERLLSNVIRNFFFARESCPTPQPDQTVYFYDRSSGVIEYLWTVPDKDTCNFMIRHKELVPPEEYGLLNFVLKYDSGELLIEAKKRNKESGNSNIVIKRCES